MMDDEQRKQAVIIVESVIKQLEALEALLCQMSSATSPSSPPLSASQSTPSSVTDDEPWDASAEPYERKL